MTDETREVMVLMGPYRDKRLTMSAADADAAINGHWAIDPHVLPDPDNPHPPLSEEERQAAFQAANDWAKQQWTASGQPGEPPVEPPVEPPPETRQMKPADEDHSGQDYTTRSGRPPRRT